MVLPSPQQLRYLVALAEHGHFSRAATACAVTQSTLSAGLIALERQLDAAILDRGGGKRPIFTPLGLELTARARKALAALAAVTEAADAARAPLSGPIRVGVIPTIGPFLLPRLMPRLRAEFPRLRIFLREDTTERLQEALGDGRLDLLLVALPLPAVEVETMPLWRDPFRLALPAGHPLAEQEPVPVPLLAGERVLLLEDGHCLRDQALTACRLAVRDDGFAATSLYTLAQMVAGGLGVTLLPELAIQGGLLAGTDLALVRLDVPDAARIIGLAWRTGSPRAGDFRALGPVIAASAEADQVRGRVTGAPLPATKG
jgi:LysR family hydrogen peroxide-inducible transcriptional activator